MKGLLSQAKSLKPFGIIEWAPLMSPFSNSTKAYSYKL